MTTLEYVFLFVVGIALATTIGYTIYLFINKPRAEQIKQIKEWLLYAEAEAERLFGSGTGALKLRYVYDAFLQRFPHFAKYISFDMFSSLVDEVLKSFRDIVSNNDSICEYVKEGQHDGSNY